MSNTIEVSADQLIQKCDGEQFSFTTTAELDVLPTLIGQSRAVEAADFGINIAGDGYNIFVMGSTGVGKYTLVRRFLEQQATQRLQGLDWAYLHNFSDPQCPRYVTLPASHGKQLRDDIERVVTTLMKSIPHALDDEYYRGRIRAIDERSRKHRVKMFGALQAEADKKGILLLRMQDGNYAFAAKRDGEPMTTDQFEQLPVDQQEKTEDLIASLHEDLQHSLLELRQWERDNQAKITALNDEVATEVINQHIDTLRHAFPNNDRLQRYFDDMQKDMRDNLQAFLKSDEIAEEQTGNSEENLLRRYQINLIVDNSDNQGAPIYYENLPSHQSLLGCVENMAMMGALVTDFSLIKAGAVHRANGGFLILDVEQVLMQPFAWEGLKRALQAKEVRFDTLERMYSLVATVSLEPEPIPLDIKIILLGNRQIYYQLYELDPEFAELFKVVADFEEDMVRTSDNELLYARLLASMVAQEDLLHLDKHAVARVIEQNSRMVEDGAKFSLHQGHITDLLRESTYWARKAGTQLVSESHVKQAITSRFKRLDRMRNQLYDQIHREVIRIAVTGEKIGQINALSLFSAGGFSFGQPSRLTANCRYGDGHIIDIEREVELGGDIHSKGVLIMSGYLGAKYAKDKPLSMIASLVFEQNYAEIEGDSATVAELCVLLSSIANLPIKQSLAVTGSMNQQGDVQAIGGVNEKIEGFFDVCKQVNFTGDQGVIIPQDNVQHLMLRQDVIDAVDDGHFHIFAVSTVDQALELLTGKIMGVLNSQGIYPEDTVNRAVMRQIDFWANIHKQDHHSYDH